MWLKLAVSSVSLGSLCWIFNFSIFVIVVCYLFVYEEINAEKKEKDNLQTSYRCFLNEDKDVQCLLIATVMCFIEIK